MNQLLSLPQFLANPKATILDVRTPAEFELGHLPNAQNLPLFTNAERAEVGTLYKEKGKDVAVLRGLELVGPKLASYVKEAKRLAKNSEIYLYCWRGGMRSGSMQWLLSTAGMRVSRLEGGYKSYRSNFEQIVEQPWQLMVLHGKTGCGKTDVLKELANLGEQVLDLEGLANHKGSVFGGMGLGCQPSTETFINHLHDTLRGFDPQRKVWCEGESMLIGHVYIPQNFFLKLTTSPIVELDLNMKCRIARLVKEYGGFDNTLLIPAFERIRKRLGNDNVKEAIEALEQGDISHAATIALRYYDKGYTMARNKRDGECIGSIYMESDDPLMAARQLIQMIYKP